MNTGGPSPNHRLDPAPSGVTALAQGRKRRATGRAGQAERYADQGARGEGDGPRSKSISPLC
jgi:hypothetical protein